MMKGVESCVDYIDSNVMESLGPRLVQLVRKGVGLPTKVWGRFIYMLFMKVRSVYNSCVLIGWMCTFLGNSLH
jgi:hypothetical protein